MKNRLLSIILLLCIIVSSLSIQASGKTGDHNGDGNVDSDDAIYLLYHVFFPESYKLAEQSEGEDDPEEYDDSGVINKDTLLYYCNTNESVITGEVKGIIIELPGLGGSSCLGGSVNRGEYTSAFTYHCAENGIVVAYLFPGPWAWGNKAEVRMADAVVDAIADKYGLGDDYPLIVCGGSMGGLGSLIYAADTSHKEQLAGVMAACPCVDVMECFTASENYPRTFVSAVASYDMPLEDALKTISPVERIEDMPDVPYFICSDGSDEVFPEAMCDEYVEDLQDAGLTVTYRKQPGLKHGEFTNDVKTELQRFMIEIGLDGDEEVNPPSAPTGNELTITSVKKISETQLEITFSEPVEKNGGVFSGIRYTGASGTSVLRTTVSGQANTVVQFSGTLSRKTSTVYTWTLSKQSAPFENITTISQILNSEGVLYGIDAPIKFCIEEVVKDENNKNVNRHFGKIDNFYAANDNTKYLEASTTASGTSWEGVYVDITVN